MKGTEEHLENATAEEIVSIEKRFGKIELYRNYSSEDLPFIVRYTGGSTSSLVWLCENMQKARLVIGVLDKMNEFGVEDLADEFGEYESTPPMIPVQIATKGNELIASYLKLTLSDGMLSRCRERVADTVGVSKNTVSNYWNRTRWDGCVECGSEKTERKTLVIDRDEVELCECWECDTYKVMPEDAQLATHDEKKPESTKRRSNCVDELEPAIGVHDGDEFQLWCCVNCGFYTADKDRHDIGAVQ